LGKAETTAKDDESATADKPDHPGAQSPKKDAEKAENSSRHETKKADHKKADKESESEGAGAK
jgi:hypothetical protein